jgi:hypothetical protein
MAVHQPIDHVKVMDVLFADVVTAQPVEVVPVVDLILEFGLFWQPILLPKTSLVPVSTGQNDITDCTISQFLDGCTVPGFVPTL